LEPVAGTDLHRHGPGHEKALGIAETYGGLAAVLSKNDPARIGAHNLAEIALGKASIAPEKERMLAQLVRPDILFLHGIQVRDPEGIQGQAVADLSLGPERLANGVIDGINLIPGLGDHQGSLGTADRDGVFSGKDRAPLIGREFPDAAQAVQPVKRLRDLAEGGVLDGCAIAADELPFRGGPTEVGVLSANLGDFSGFQAGMALDGAEGVGSGDRTVLPRIAREDETPPILLHQADQGMQIATADLSGLIADDDGSGGQLLGCQDLRNGLRGQPVALEVENLLALRRKDDHWMAGSAETSVDLGQG